MNKTEFLQYLEKGLKARRVEDVEDILMDYREYFDQQLARGKKEADVVLSIGDPDSIIDDYDEIQGDSRKNWFETVAVSMVALPVLIINYGLLIVLIATAFAFWLIAVYYAFSLESFSFMPNMPLLPKIGFILSSLITAIFLASGCVRYYGMLKSMTKQYVVKQTIRIGDFVQSPIYEKVFKVSLILMIVGYVATYLIAAIVARDWQFWHVWDWFV